MKDCALLVLDGNWDKAAGFLKEKAAPTDINESSEDVIRGSFPVLVARSGKDDFSDEFRPFADDDLVFCCGNPDSVLDWNNEAGQSISDVLEILEIKNVFICGNRKDSHVSEAGDNLSAAGINVYFL